MDYISIDVAETLNSPIVVDYPLKGPPVPTVAAPYYPEFIFKEASLAI